MVHSTSIRHTLAAISRRVFIGIIKAYRFLLSPWVGQHCRFTPSCSLYAIESIEHDGVWRGAWKTLKRLARCHPWCEGGYDPVTNNQETLK